MVNMEPNKYQATKAKEIAEKKFKDMDFSGAKKFALKAQDLCPDLDGLSQFLSTLEVYIRAEKRINGEVDWYSILGVEPLADEITIRRHYKKHAFSLHPDRNKSVGADGAFKLISQAWSLLSDADSRSAHDRKRKLRGMDRQMNGMNFTAAGQNRFGNNRFADIFRNENNIGTSYPAPAATIPVQPKPTFWTKCHNCNTHFEYQIKHYLQRICCCYCHKPFFTFEVPPPPHFHNNASSASRIPHPRYKMFSSSCLERQPYASCKTAAAAINHSQKECMPGVFSSDGENNNISSISRMSGQQHWMFNSSWREMESNPPGKTAAVAVNRSQIHSNSGVFSMLDGLNENAAKFTAQFSDAVPSASNNLKRAHDDDTVLSFKRKKCHLGISHGTNRTVTNPCAVSGVTTSISAAKVVERQRRMQIGESRIDSYTKETETEFAGRNGVSLASGCGSQKGTVETAKMNFVRIPKRNCAKDISQEKIKIMLLEKARNEINKKLNECCAISLLRTLRESNVNKQVKEIYKERPESAVSKIRNNGKHSQEGIDSKRVVPTQDVSTAMKCSDPVLMNVPDPDFHDFDKDRTEKSFGDSQVWAAYDDDDGMPRYYAMIHGIVSLKPFKMKISWLNSKGNEELAPLKWIASGFPKTSGEFRVGKPEFNGLLNSFSHRVRWTKGLKGAILIYPKKGDVWALYRNWSPEWNVLTPDEVIHEYDMIEVLEDYNGEQGVNVAPLVKVPGFKTIFLRHSDPAKIMTIPKEELFRFSHQVPSFMLSVQEGLDVPNGSLELDPAATPMELLQVLPKTQKDGVVLTTGAALEDGLKFVGEKDEKCQNCQTTENDCLEDTARKVVAESMVEKELKEDKLLVYRRQRFRKQKMLERT